MSYSRWSNSRWYTFWCVAQGDAVENRDNARFEVMDANASLSEKGRWFSAAEIRENPTACVGKFAGTVEELQELKDYMLEFAEDVDRHYMNKG